MGSRPTCAYCVAPATTDDHIPPKALYPPRVRRRAQLITVRACATCNSAWKLDDEYFVRTLAHAERSGECAAAVEIANKLSRGLDHPSAWRARRAFAASIGWYNEVSLGGIILGKKLGMRVVPDRLHRTVKRIVRGLYYRHFERRTPDGWGIRVIRVRDMDPSAGENAAILDRIVGNLPTMPGVAVDLEVFAYKFNREGDDGSVGWYFYIYQEFEFIALLSPEIPPDHGLSG